MEVKSTPSKIVVVGDAMVGKTCLCKSYVKKATLVKQPYQPTVSETHEVSVLVNGKLHSIILWDTAGTEEWEHFRSKDYVNTDCFLCCYSVDNRTSFDNVESKWIPELRAYSPTTVPVVIVGLKKDLRTSSDLTMIQPSDGQSLQSRVKAHGFIEASSTSQTSLEGIFLLAVSCIQEADKLGKSFQGCFGRKFQCHIL